MYEDYVQNYIAPQGYPNTYDFNMENYPYSYMNSYEYTPGYPSVNRTSIAVSQDVDLEELYPDIYKIVYPMIKKVCSKHLGPVSREVFENMVDEVNSNIESNNSIQLNINVNNIGNEQRSNGVTSSTKIEKKEPENRESRRMGVINDLVRILLIRELLKKKPCFGNNCRPRPIMPPRPPYLRYEF